jgi:molybdenum cofactor cytidylyltransferase
VVIRPEDNELRAKLSRFPIEVIFAEDAHAGMGHSLAAGFKGLTWHWAFIALLDMPFVQTNTLIKLKEFVMSNPEANILRPCLPATLSSPVNSGHPIGWHESYFQRLRACSGDVGAKALLQQYADNITDIVVNDDGIIRDIDRPSDLDQP